MFNKRKIIRDLIISKTGKNPYDNFTILENKKGECKVKVLWERGKEEIIRLKI